MNKGVLIFAHNNREVDYALHSIISGGLVVKHLKVPVSLVTDPSTVEWMKTSGTFEKAVAIFDHMIIISRPESDNTRRLYDGTLNKVVPFNNANRSSAWELTPYDRTLLIDSDFLIFSDRLNEYWDVDEDFLIADSMNDINSVSRAGYQDRYVSETGVHMYWATNVMFTKNEHSKALFDMVEFVRDNYQYYGDLFRFAYAQYRNDISFSVAKHILNGFETEHKQSLPAILTTLDKDILESVDETGRLRFLISPMLDSNFCLASTKGLDVHVMNKDSITRNAESLLKLI